MDELLPNSLMFQDMKLLVEIIVFSLLRILLNRSYRQEFCASFTKLYRRSSGRV